MKELKGGNGLEGNLLSQDAGGVEMKWKVSPLKMDTYYSEVLSTLFCHNCSVPKCIGLPMKGTFLGII